MEQNKARWEITTKIQLSRNSKRKKNTLVLVLPKNTRDRPYRFAFRYARCPMLYDTILHSAIKTHAEKHDERLQAELQLERARTIEALEEAARTKASPPTACGAPRESAEGQGARGLHTSIRDLASSVLALVHACGPGEGAKKAANAGL